VISFAIIPFNVHAKTNTVTYHLDNVTETVYAWNTCLGSIKGTLTYDAVMHVTENSNSYHSVLEMNGIAFVEPLSPQYPDFTGHFSEIQVFHTLKDQAFLVWIITTLGEDLEFHITYKVSYEDQGPVVEIYSVTCGN
jgi:hypothetical protein